MSNPESDVLDEIDALVEYQLAQEPSGYDHNINQDKCPHCDRDWHGMPLTRRVEQIRQAFAMGDSVDQRLADYRADEDDSQLLCPGSMFIGPRAPTSRDKWSVKIGIDADGNRAPIRGAVVGFQIHPDPESLERLRESWESFHANMVEYSRTITVTFQNISADLRRALEGTGVADSQEIMEQSPQQRALPRPSPTPPIWAARADGRRRR